MTAALITGVAGETLSGAERAFFKDVRPAGLILFARNCKTADQIRALVDDVREMWARSAASASVPPTPGDLS